MITWHSKTYQTHEEHVCHVKGVGVIIVERNHPNDGWHMHSNDLHGRTPLSTFDLDKAKSYALLNMRNVISGMMEAINKAISESHT